MNEDSGPIVPGVPSSAPAPGGGGGRDQGDRAAALAAYVEANRGRYTDEALRRAASSAGYTDPEIDAAWSTGAGATAVDSARPRPHRLVAIAVAILYVVGVYFVVAFFGSMAQPDLTLPAYLIAGIAGMVAWALLRERRPSLALGFGYGVILAVILPVVLFLVLLGICIASGGTPYLPGG